MVMKSIDSDIRNGSFKNIYLLIGVEPYLIHQYRDKLVNALISSDDELNLRRYTGEIPDVIEVMEYADTVPFFAERRVIVLEDTGIFKSSDDRLAEYLKIMPATSYMIFVECFRGDKSGERKYEKSLVDKRLKLYKTVHELGRIVEFDRISDDMLVKWLLKKFADAGLNVTKGAMECLLEYCGNDMMRLSNEAEKLICYRMGHSSLNTDDVRDICARSIDNDIFEMVGAIAVKNRRKALKLYYDLLELKESPMKILSLIAREFNLLMQVKAIKVNGGSRDDIVKAVGINPFFAGKYISVSGRFSPEYLKKAVADCVETETLFKQGRINDVIGVEMLILKYSAQ